MNSLFVNAIKEAAKVRDIFGLRMFEPLNIYDLCHEANVLVRIVNINMEGIYIKADSNKKATILLSNERPLTRRVFTCAHEYGHHYFGHGSKIDALDYSNKYTSEQNQEELLVNSFAGSLLMPIGGVKSQFSKRNLQPTYSDPLNFYTISSYFGVGYQTLIYHCLANRLIGTNKSKELLKYSPAKILKQFFTSDIQNAHFKYVDDFSQPSIVELEVNNYLILPKGSDVDRNYLVEKARSEESSIFLAEKPGISEVESNKFKKNIQVRIAPKNFVGLSQYRHLE